MDNQLKQIQEEKQKLIQQLQELENQKNQLITRLIELQGVEKFLEEKQKEEK